MSTLFGKSHQRKRSKRKQEEAPSLSGDNEKNNEVARIKQVDTSSPWAGFDDLGLTEPLVKTCRSLGFQRPTPVQRTIIPYLLQNESANILALASTGSGKTAAFCLPIIHKLSLDPYGIYAVIITPTRELAKQIHQQVLALGSAFNIQSTLVVGGLDSVKQSCELDKKPHFVVSTPGRLAELLRGPNPPRLKHVRYLVLDEADRLLAADSGFERDIAELLLHCRDNHHKNRNNTRENNQRNRKCQTLLFSATMTRSLESVEKIAGGGGDGRLPLEKFVIRETDDSKHDPSSGGRATKKQKTSKELHDDTSEEEEGSEDLSDEGRGQTSGETSEETSNPRIPAGLKQEYIFMPSRVRDAYMLTTIRTVMSDGGRRSKRPSSTSLNLSKGVGENGGLSDDDEIQKARSAIVFVSTCERAALVSGILSQVGVDNVALHSLLSQNRRLAALGKFKSQQVRVLVATSLASRGLDIPTVDLVLNVELPRSPVDYVHRVGRTARAGRRGRAISLVAESDVSLVHAVERETGRPLEKCTDVTDEAAIRMLAPVTKASRLAKMKLMDIGFDDLVKKFKERKVRDRKERKRIEKALKRSSTTE